VVVAKNRSSKAIRIAVVTLVIVCLGLAAFFYFQRKIVPNLIAKSLRTNSEESYLIPGRLKPTIAKARIELNKQMDSIPKLLNSLHLTFDELIYITETLDANQVIQSINELSKTELRDTDQVFNILKKNITIEGYDLELFRNAFKEKVTLDKVERALKKINDNQLTTTVSIPVARETVKQVLFDNREKLERNLESLQKMSDH